MKRRRVVITGLGVVAPNGIGKDAFWASLAAGHSVVEYYPFRFGRRQAEEVLAVRDDYATHF